jgi:Kef-type K+ transport system membrane component KefB
VTLTTAAEKVAAKTPLPDRTAQVFIAIVFIVILARLLGRLFRRIGQPPVIGEILAGILLGTSVLGQFHSGSKTLTATLFPSDVVPILKAFANLGLIIFMFIIGLELDLRLIRGNERKAGVISLSSILVPFLGGAALALYLYNNHSQGGLAAGKHVDKLPFALFIGASMCVTAFPVLARILNERGMTRTPLGVIALACAAIDDVVAWSLLAVVSALASDSGEPLWEVLVYSLVFIVVMFAVVRPLLSRFLLPIYKSAGRLTPDVLAFLLVGLIFSSWITDHIGIHFIFGAFVFGVIIPREGTEMLFQEILERLEQVSVLLLLPIFFIVTGLSVDLTKLTGRSVSELFAVLGVAIGGKFLGAYFAGRVQGIPQRRSGALALLMNTRGLTELVLLSVGLKLKVLDVPLFTMLVVMALITTIMTAPLLKIVYPDRLVAHEVEEAERAALGIPNAYRVMVVLDEAQTDAPLVTMAADLAASEQPSQVVLSVFRQQATAQLEIGSGLSVELAEMAGVMAELEALAEQVRARGVDCVVLSRFSVDPTADAISQATTLDADVLVLSPTANVNLERLLANVEIAVAAWDGATAIAQVSGPVTALARSGDEAEAAITLALRLAAVRGSVLALVDDGSRRRISGLVERLERFGVSVEVITPDQLTSGILLVDVEAAVPAGAPGVLRVRPNKLQDQSDLAKLIEAGTVLTGRPAAVTI